ncbi:hypothetical protein HGL72_000600 [Escherichia coli]|uniref:CDP-glycerol glycerophosphotransferase family protein n=1 Tax=Escherichia coli TaxID=562 RepID=UPI0012FF929E|nr:CDP-glycerol glycerophosphotransferase family protein [Escherichia coli]EFJ3710711.1 hypothetical protein [Escherichia coli]EFJ3817525.1 hypothetical protein [Escherichia coli]EFN0712259.1 hypothetical protein [Escherichia coli]
MIKKLKLKIYALSSYLLGHFLNADDDLWIIGAGNGYVFGDNSRYFYQWVIEKKNKKIFWVTKDLKIYHALSKNEKTKDRVIYFYSLKSILFIARAKVFICSHGVNDITPYVCKNRKLICLWHGLPIKKIGDLTLSSYGKDNPLERGIKHVINSKKEYDAFLSPSLYYKEIFEKSFEGKISEFIYAQYPRVTELKNKSNDIADNSDIKTILYAPTFRDFVAPSYYEINGIVPSKKLLSELNGILGYNRYKLIIKLHPYICIENSYMHELIGFNNIIFANKNDDVLDLLINASVLITDYSSICFDFLTLGKEVIFLMPDYDQYVGKTRGLNFELKDFAPGKIFTNWNDLIKYIPVINRKFTLDDDYLKALKMSNEFHTRKNSYIFDFIEKRAKL